MQTRFDGTVAMDDAGDEPFEVLLRYLRDSRGFDFTGYKRASLERRIRHRMDNARCTSFDEYLDLLQTSSEEFAALFNTILINVTSFFRDPEAWEYVASNVIPQLLAQRGPTDPLRVWSAGCASGQEAYTLAMLLAEALGQDGFRHRVKIYATDVDEEALTEARAATYDAKDRRIGAARPSHALLRRSEGTLRLSQGPAPRGHLRPQRSGQGRTDLPGRPPGLPQYPDVPQRRDAADRAGAAALRAGPPGRPLPRPCRDVVEPPRPLHAHRPQEPDLRKGHRIPHRGRAPGLGRRSVSNARANCPAPRRCASSRSAPAPSRRSW